MKQYLKPTLIIVGIILLATTISRVINNSESLTEYAEHNKASHATETTSVSPKTETATNSAEDIFETPVSTETDIALPEEEKKSTDSNETSVNNTNKDVALSFYYEPLSEEIINKISGISYVENENIALDDLRYLHILHYNFDDEIVEGELICNESIAKDLLEIFYELYLSEYKIDKVRLIDEYNGDDTASMEDNNTSCFNYRVVDGTTKLSKHAYGLAIDINPFYNPYVVFQSDGSTYISPKGSEIYTDRSTDFPYKIDENDLCYKLFKEHGFTWGGDWNSCKDYQHFQKNQ